jgi:para-nitrobenzyl esterase
VRRGGEIEHDTDMRGSKQRSSTGLRRASVPSDFAAELTFLSFDEALAMYRQDDPAATPFVIQARFDTDQTFRKSAITQTELKAKQGVAPVWRYLWQVPTVAYDGRYGTPHGSDVGPSLHDVRGGSNDTSHETVARADQLASAWILLASTGNPNNPKTLNWPAHTLSSRTTMVWDHIARAENDPRGKFREFWEKQAPMAAF